MKEATGGLNSAIVVMLAVGVLIAFFYYTLWPIIEGNFAEKTKCSKAVCQPCPNKNNDCDVVSCQYKGKNITCVYKG